MLTAEEIKSLARSGEGYNVDFNVRVPSKIREITTEICAFANSDGGYLILGIDNNGKIRGLEKEFGTKSMSRNPLVFGLFTRMGLVEQVASGIPRMRDEMEKAGLPEPVFTVDGGFFTVAFKRPKVSKTKHDPINDPINLNDIILQIITKNEGVSAPDIAKHVNKSLKTVKRYIAKLKEVDKIEFRGVPKTGGYYLKEK